MIPAGKSEKQAKQFAKDFSILNKGEYVTLFSCFGIFLNHSKNLNIFAPSDSLFGVYWLIVIEKPFTTKQKIADEQNTPTLN